MTNLLVNNTPISVEPGTTILHAAQQAGADVPTICYHEACTANALCRMCVVEVEGARTLVPACVAKVSEGMKVQTETPRVERSRRTILEMLSSAVDLSEAPEIQAQMQAFGANAERFPEAERRDYPLFNDNPMFVRDYSKCIMCWRCVQVCGEDAQYAFAIGIDGRGYHSHIGTFANRPMPESTCVFCGQCVGVCPTNALQPEREFLLQKGHTPDEVIELTRVEQRRRKRIER
ncbi:MAG TPA: 2Fe-2S iron-sulfur cluster-binding protein [Thermoflexales bacterium]|nr:2Fe-2S iron-sulfur cluster-binding protein [Thermoflexales bacterium]HQZ22057.1 2Fe-2S iron-sulfur cluster-binding protein [Thermoflexales bacterium]